MRNQSTSQLKRFASLAVVGLAAAAAAACGGGDESSSDDSSSVTSMEALQGTWDGACKAVGDGYGVTTLTFTDTTFFYKSEAFLDEGCEELDNYLVMRGTYALPGDTETEDGTPLAMIDYTNVAATWTFKSGPTEALDWSKLCDDAPVEHYTVDLLGKTCTAGSTSLNFAAATFGSIYVLEGNIYPSDLTTNGATAVKRSVKVDKLAKLVVRGPVETGTGTETSTDTATEE
jgi:hypothetical protein